MEDFLKQLDCPSESFVYFRKTKEIKDALLNNGVKKIKKNIAVLGGSTTFDIVRILDLFLLFNGIEANFYECEYNKYYEDIMFENEKLKAFKPDLIWFHTSYRNLLNTPDINDSVEIVKQKLQEEYEKYLKMWQKCFDTFSCTIIQNNFEQPCYRIMGNKDVSDCHGLMNFISELNMKFYNFAQNNDNFYINDLNFVASNFGLEKWHDFSAWYLYKYCCNLDAIPYLAHNVNLIIKSIYGKNKKGFVLDLDNTLWGGVVGEDGVENLEIGQEIATGQAYSEFQQYLKKLMSLGVILNINSKNDENNALAGLNHPESILKPNDFISIKANWNTKSQNMQEIATELSLTPDSLVFVDDNPAEREIVKQNVKDACVPDISQVENYIKEIDKHGYFEVTALSDDDLSKNNMYKSNVERAKFEICFENYYEYLKSLDMKAEIKPFSDVYMQRIAQLTNKSNQFNLTTKRYSKSELEQISASKDNICLYGKLQDKFGDNGIVSVLVARKDITDLHIDLFLMSCRVLKRGMEFAMLDELVKIAKAQGITNIIGYYYKTQKNNLVKDLFKQFGFTLKEANGEDSIWTMNIENYINKQSIIMVN